MDRQPSGPVKTLPNGPHDLLARLYREVGVSAVAAALAPATPVPTPVDVEPAHLAVGKAA